MGSRSSSVLVTVYSLTLCCIALVLLGKYSLEISRGDWRLLLLLSLLIVIFSRLSVATWLRKQFNLSSTVQLVTLLVGGLPLALWAATISAVAEEFIEGWKPKRAIYNTSQRVITLFATGQVFLLLDGQTGPAFNHPFQALGASFAGIAVNSVLIGILFALLSQQSFTKVLSGMNQEKLFHTYFMGQVLGIAATFLWVRGGPQWTLMLLMLLLTAQFSLRRYFNLLHDAEQRRQLLETVFDATHSGIVMVDKSGRVRVANRRFGQMIGVDSAKLLGERFDDLAENPFVREVRAGQTRLREMGSGRAGDLNTLTLKLADAQRIFLEWYHAPVRSEDATLRTEQEVLEGYIDVYTDITAQKEAEENLRRIHMSVLKALTAAIDVRDAYTHGHSSRVSEFSRVIARRLGLDEGQVELITYAGLLHDIGKLAIDDRVLRKDGPLSPDERALMMAHPVIGAQVLERAGIFTELVPGVKHHHEWYNGGGYPSGLKGAEIPIDARIIGAVDAFDAMTTDRPYRAALTEREALDRLKAAKGIQFDGNVVDALVGAVEDGEIIAQALSSLEGASVSEVVDEVTAGMIRPHHGQELSILYQVSQENYARLDTGAMLRRFLEIFHKTIGHNAYMIFLTDEETGDLVLQSSLGAEENKTGMRLKPGQGAVGRAAQEGRAVVVNDLGTTPIDPDLVPGARCQLAVPLVFDGRVHGVLAVGAALPGAFDRDDLDLFKALAQQVANAVELARYHERLSLAAHHDGLTGVYNHSHFYERLTEEVERARRHSRECTVVLLDLDGLKAINDTHGHLAGDKALKEYAARLRVQLREYDILARYGGDEFAIIMPETSKRAALQVVRRLSKATRYDFVLDDRLIPLPTAAYGVATFPGDGERPTELVTVADRDMYQHKKSSRPVRHTAP